MSQITETQITALEERLRQAMLDSDVAVLDELIADELLFTNHLGAIITKPQDLANFESRALQLTELVPSEKRIQIHPEFAVVSVLMHLSGSFQGTPIDANIRYTRVWAMSADGTMLIVAGHASALFG